MKLYPMRKDGHTAFVKKGQIPFMQKYGWELTPYKNQVRIKVEV